MNKYEQFILNIIINRGRFAIPDTEYTEVHHIIPECMGGTSEKENLVQLYAREHLVAHKLLADIYPSQDKIQYAFDRMLGYKKYDGALSPAEYERAKKKKSERMSERFKNNPELLPKPPKPVEAIDPGSGQRMLCFDSVISAERAGLGFDNSGISRCCNGKQKTHKGFIWRFVEGGSERMSDRMSERLKNNPELLPRSPKPVEAIDPESGQRMLCFDSARSAERAGPGFNHTSISACCNGKRKTHKGFIWRFVEGGSERMSDRMSERLKNNPELLPTPPKPVEAIDPESGQRMLCFDSARSAERAGLGFNHTSISACCNGKRKTHKGFIWRFVEGGNDSDGDN